MRIQSPSLSLLHRRSVCLVPRFPRSVFVPALPPSVCRHRCATFTRRGALTPTRDYDGPSYPSPPLCQRIALLVPVRLMLTPSNRSSHHPVLAARDPELAEMLEKEMARQYRGLEMIASENFTSRAVLECLGSALSNKYAEGLVGARYYGGTQYVDEVERLAQERALKAFGLSADEWGVNVQPYSGSPANFAVYTALLPPHSRIMGLGLDSGGHLTHGFYTAKKRISATSIYFESLPYRVNAQGLIDYDRLEEMAEIFRPRMIVAGASAYSREIDYARFRAICDAQDCVLFVDMAHTAGLIAAGALQSPFRYADVVSTTTHKTLRGPRAGMIFYRKKDVHTGEPTDYESRVNQAVFPGLQGGPHMHQIAAIATQMREVASPMWKAYARQVQLNAKTLATCLMERGYELVSGGTDNHLMLWNVRAKGITGSKMEKLFEALSISVNKNTIPGDKSAMSPGGVRLGLPALTTRGMTERDMEPVANFLDRGLRLGLDIQSNCPSSKLADFVAAAAQDARVRELREEIESFAAKYDMPSFDPAALKYRDGLPQDD